MKILNTILLIIIVIVLALSTLNFLRIQAKVAELEKLCLQK